MSLRTPLTALLLAACALGAAPVETAYTTSPAPCSAAEAKQFDFWLGDWEVYRRKDGVRIGHNHFERVVGGCAISEHFVSPPADARAALYEGVSLTTYDPADGLWRQFYVDNRGRRSEYSGGLKGGAMVLVGPSVMPGRGRYLQRMTVTAQPDGTVRQSGAFSTDDGATWRDTYDFDYRRK